MRQSARRARKNLKKREAYKNAVKEVRKLVSAKQLDEARKKLASAYKALDKAAKTNVINKNKASRLKSRLAKLLKK